MKEVINRSDIVLEILDARLVEETRNEELEKKIEIAGKKIIFVLNKCDLVSKKILEKEKRRLQKIHPTVFVSSKLHQGTKKLRDEILKNTKLDKIKVGVLGYPNVGKSSVINVLRGRRVAKTSSYSGYTRGLQDINITNRITLVDTPGVIPFLEKDEVKHALIAVKNVQQIKNPENVATHLISFLEDNGVDIASLYNAKKGMDEDETLDNIALAQNKLIKGGKPDVERMARMIIKDWQSGKIKIG